MTPFTEEELTELALGADPDPEIPTGAVPFDLGRADGLLPSWYMPAPVRADGWRGRVIGIVILLVLGINVLGLCVTYGFPEIGFHLP
jgi:hypothetical protein